MFFREIVSNFHKLLSDVAYNHDFPVDPEYPRFLCTYIKYVMRLLQLSELLLALYISSTSPIKIIIGKETQVYPSFFLETTYIFH